MPPFWAAVEILASPIANRGIPQACDRPTLGLVAAGPADTGPFTKVIGATTGARPTAQPASNTAQQTASVQTLNMSMPLPWLIAPHRSRTIPSFKTTISTLRVCWESDAERTSAVDLLLNDIKTRNRAG